MGKLVLVTGGARSGKSTFAEKRAIEIGGDFIYVATAIPFDDEMKLRIKLHKKRRPQSFVTIEEYKDLDNAINEVIGKASGVLIDCITVMITNLMMDYIKDWDNISENEAENAEKLIIMQIDKIIDFAKSTDKTILVVTNEVGSGIVPMYASARLFRDIAGRANQRLATAADEVFLCVSSIPVKIK